MAGASGTTGVCLASVCSVLGVVVAVFVGGNDVAGLVESDMLADLFLFELLVWRFDVMVVMTESVLLVYFSSVGAVEVIYSSKKQSV